MVLCIDWGSGHRVPQIRRETQTCVNISHKKSEILPLTAIQMDLEGITQSGESQTKTNAI